MILFAYRTQTWWVMCCKHARIMTLACLWQPLDDLCILNALESWFTDSRVFTTQTLAQSQGFLVVRILCFFAKSVFKENPRKLLIFWKSLPPRAAATATTTRREQFLSQVWPRQGYAGIKYARKGKPLTPKICKYISRATAASPGAHN